MSYCGEEDRRHSRYTMRQLPTYIIIWCLANTVLTVYLFYLSDQLISAYNEGDRFTFDDGVALYECKGDPTKAKNLDVIYKGKKTEFRSYLENNVIVK